MLWAACFSLMLTFVYNFNKTPWFPLMWMVRFVTFVHKDLFPDKYLWSSTWEIHLKILQPTPWEPVSIVEVVNKSEHERKTSSPQHSRCSYASGELIRINFHPKTAEKMAPHCMARLDLVNCTSADIYLAPDCFFPLRQHTPTLPNPQQLLLIHTTSLNENITSEIIQVLGS